MDELDQFAAIAHHLERTPPPAEPTEAELGPQPCFGCECCELWTGALEQLEASIRAHVAGELRLKPCSEDCLVCAAVDWQRPG